MTDSKDTKSALAVAAIGADRPGIVAAASRALHHAGFSIDDSAMTILGDHFAMLLVIEKMLDQNGRANPAPTDDHLAEARQALAPVAEEFSLTLEVMATGAKRKGGPTGREANSGHADGAAGGTTHSTQWCIAAYGPDRPGLVAALSTVLADNNVNITDFGSRLTAGGTFAMWFNVEIPGATNTAALTRALEAAGGEAQLEVNLEPLPDDGDM